MNAFYISTLVIMFVFSAWICFGHRNNLGSSDQDLSHDPIFSKIGMWISLGGLIATFLYGILFRMGIFSLEEPYIPQTFEVYILGLALFSGGVFIRLKAIRDLGYFFTFEIGIRPGHRVVKIGIYSIVRHPSYLGFVFLVVGFATCTGSMIVFLSSVIPMVIFFIMRIYSEEKMLVSHFGDEYREYMKTTKRLIPYVF
ncbi:MAG: isoprenylcysteine carboxylmethyltransferase family protein [Bacteriovoracia bacterium]